MQGSSSHLELSWSVACMHAHLLIGTDAHRAMLSPSPSLTEPLPTPLRCMHALLPLPLPLLLLLLGAPHVFLPPPLLLLGAALVGGLLCDPC